MKVTYFFLDRQMKDKAKYTSPPIETNCGSNAAVDVANMFHILRCVSNRRSMTVVDVEVRCELEAHRPSYFITFAISFVLASRILDDLYEEFIRLRRFCLLGLGEMIDEQRRDRRRC